MAQKPGALPALCSFSTQELLDEVERRSLGALCVCVRVEESSGGWGDAWHYRVKGSSIMLGAMSAAITLQMQRELEERGREDGNRMGRMGRMKWTWGAERSVERGAWSVERRA